MVTILFWFLANLEFRYKLRSFTWVMLMGEEMVEAVRFNLTYKRTWICTCYVPDCREEGFTGVIPVIGFDQAGG